MNAQVWRRQRSIGVFLVFMIGLVVLAAYFSVKEKHGAAIDQDQGLKRLADDGLTAVGKDLDHLVAAQTVAHDATLSTWVKEFRATH